MGRIGFDNQAYITIQSEKIRERIAHFGGKLYLEFGGKLFDDFHASRVLPGFEPDSKLRMLMQLRDDLEIVIAINAADIERNKIRGDLGITYGDEVLRMIDVFSAMGLSVSGVAVTRYQDHQDQSAAGVFLKRLDNLGIRCYRHYPIAGYPSDVEHIVSPEGLGRNEYIETSRSLVVVTAPGPGSGKLATCISQLYHDAIHGVRAGYAKFETFPIWNLSLEHPVNLAYEAATADLSDVNMIDPFHLEYYQKTAVNYNRDIDTFPVLSATLAKIMGESPYHSPTDMGVNMVGMCITDDNTCRDAARREILRRYYNARMERTQGKCDDAPVKRMDLIMRRANVTPEINPAVAAALEKAEDTGAPAAAMILPDGRMVRGKTSDTLGAASSLLLNALKAVGGIGDSYKLISNQVLEPVCELKTRYMGHRNPRLHTDEVLMALTISALTNPLAEMAQRQLPKLKDSDAHFSVILSEEDINLLKQLGIRVTCEPVYETKRLYHK